MGEREAKQAILKRIFEVAVSAAHPKTCLPSHLPPPPKTGRLYLLSCGKAAAMAQVALAHYAERLPPNRILAHVTTRHGHGLALPHPFSANLQEAGHPIPDTNSQKAAETALALAHGTEADDLFLVLLSGGASALWAAPLPPLTLGDKQNLTAQLLASGADIQEINCVRKHLSRIKGGRLALAAAPASLVTLAISDVPGDDPTTIGSGPTVPDPTTLADARAILARRKITPNDTLATLLSDPANETPKPGEPAFAGHRYAIIANGMTALRAAAEEARTQGYDVLMLGDRLMGEARALAQDHARLALSALVAGRKLAIISGGEATVTVTGSGIGGPNQEYALALAIALEGAPGIHALAADTDGADGGAGRPDDPAGAFVHPDTLARAETKQRNAAIFLDNNDSGRFFRELSDTLICGPTQTNVNDLRVILVDPDERPSPNMRQA